MKLVVVDLEMNQPSSRIIQIGAVCFRPEAGELIDTFDQLVHPGESISPEIVALTGISDEAVAQTPKIQVAAEKFVAFKKQHQASPIGIVWGAGLSNDVRKIFDEAQIESPFRSRIIDVKGVFQMYANASGARIRQKVGLSKACEILQLGWDEKFGPPHRALADAYNTVRLYLFFSKCLKGGVEIKLG
jgi:DNA polymerase III epsilon subunit-like protein